MNEKVKAKYLIEAKQGAERKLEENLKNQLRLQNGIETLEFSFSFIPRMCQMQFSSCFFNEIKSNVDVLTTPRRSYPILPSSFYNGTFSYGYGLHEETRAMSEKSLNETYYKSSSGSISQV